MNENIIKAFNELAVDILDLFKKVLASDVGINKKVGKNTLKRSRLARTATIDADAPFIKLMVNDYIESIEQGRRERQMPLVPIQDLREWAQRKGIKSDNHTLHIIQGAIWRDGIKGRPVMKRFYQLLEKEWNETYANELFNEIMRGFEIWFNKG